jgi:cell division protein FtsB
MRRPWFYGISLFLLLILQGQLWLGRGSLPTVWRMQKKLQEAQMKLEKTQQTHLQLVAQVRDLADGLDLVEEKARNELGMIKPGETLVQWVSIVPVTPSPSSSSSSIK